MSNAASFYCARPSGQRNRFTQNRRGIVAVLAVILIPVLMVFLAFSVDTGRVSLTKARMQTACDAASLAASQEIVASIEQAGEDGGDAGDANSISVEAARQVAIDVAQENGVHVDGQKDVHFGKRTMDESSGEWTIEWDAGGPYNVIQVTARRDNPDSQALDSEFPLTFGNFVGVDSVPLITSATAFIETRDIAVVLDFSGSMTYDSCYKSSSVDRLGKEAIDENKLDIYNALEQPDIGDLPWEPAGLTIIGAPPTRPQIPQCKVTFTGKTTATVYSSKDLSNVVVQDTEGNTYKYDDLSGGYEMDVQSPTGYPIAKIWVKSGANDSGDGPGYGECFERTVPAVIQAYDLDNTQYPYNSGSWYDFISFCHTSSDLNRVGYQYKYGGKCFVEYLNTKKRSHAQTPDLWKAPQYPFQAVKSGCTLFLSFLDNLEFDDQVGLVSYATTAKIEDQLFDGDESIDLSNDPICRNFADLNTIQVHKQAAHYSPMTNIGGGIKKGVELLDGYGRHGSRRTLLVMTDGNANITPSDVTIPAGWDWDELTDYDGDGQADYSTTNSSKKAAFAAAMEGVAKGYTIHTISVGADADRDLMKALAFAGGGTWIDIPGGSTVEEMEEQLLEAFGEVAAKVPPPKLIDAEVQ